MFKKFTALLLLVVILGVSSISNFAATSLENIIENPKTSATDQFLLTITRPEGDESTFKKSYVLCGVTELEHIRVRVLVYNDTTEEYQPYSYASGDNVWDVGASGIFMKEINLAKGANKIRVVAYKKGNESKLKLKQNLQVNDFTVTLLDEGSREGSKSSILDYDFNKYIRFYKF